VSCSWNAFAKVILLFFAVLFLAVLIHPDVDLLAVHDVRISSARSQVRSVEGRCVQLMPSLSGRPQIEQPFLLKCLQYAQEAGPSSDQSSPSILRI